MAANPRLTSIMLAKGNNRRFSEIPGVLYRNRYCFGLVYAIVLFFTGLAVQLRFFGLDLHRAFFLDLPAGWSLHDGLWLQPPFITILWLLALTLAQVGFLRLGGNITRAEKAQWRILLPLAIASVFVFCSSFATVTCLQFWTPMQIEIGWWYWSRSLPPHVSYWVVLLFVLVYVGKCWTTNIVNGLTLLSCFVLATAFVAISLLVATLAAGAFHGRVDLWLVAMLALAWALGCAFFLLGLRGKREVNLDIVNNNQLSERTPAVKNLGVKGGPYVASAASTSTVLLAILYFGITQAIPQISHAHRVLVLRNALGDDLSKQYLSPLAVAIKRLGPKDYYTVPTIVRGALRDLSLPGVPGVAAITVKPLRPLVEEPAKTGNDNQPEWFVHVPPGPEFPDLYLEVLEYGESRPWIVLLRWYGDLSATNQVMTVENSSVARRASIEGISPAKEENIIALFVRTERELLRKEVTFPNAGLVFPVSQAVWLSNVVAFFMVVLIRDRVRHVLDDPVAGIGEPWLVLDASDRTGRWVARLWTLGIVAGPWLLAVCTATMVIARIRIDPTSTAMVLLYFCALVALMSFSSLLSLSLASDILRIRRLQEFLASTGGGGKDGE